MKIKFKESEVSLAIKCKYITFLILLAISVSFVGTFFSYPYFWLELLLFILFSCILLTVNILNILNILDIFSFTKIIKERKTIKQYSIGAFWIIIFFAYSYFTFEQIINRSLDVPYLISSNYSSVIGNPTNINKYKNKQNFWIQGVHFSVESKAIENTPGSKYKVTYLPHSRYVLNIEEVNE